MAPAGCYIWQELFFREMVSERLFEVLEGELWNNLYVVKERRS